MWVLSTTVNASQSPEPGVTWENSLKQFLHQKRLEGELQLSPSFAFCSPCFVFTCSPPAFQEAKGHTEKNLLIFSLRAGKGDKRECHLPPHLLHWADITSRDAGLVQRCSGMASSIHHLHFPFLCNQHVWGLQHWIPPGTLQRIWGCLFLPLFFTHLHTEYCQALLSTSFPFMLLDNRKTQTTGQEFLMLIILQGNSYPCFSFYFKSLIIQPLL